MSLNGRRSAYTKSFYSRALSDKIKQLLDNHPTTYNGNHLFRLLKLTLNKLINYLMLMF